MAFLTNSEKDRISQAIRDVEARTSGELVTVLATASDGYRYIPIMVTALIALAVPLALVPLTRLAAEDIYIIQLGVFLVLSLATLSTHVRVRLIPPSVRQRRCARTAREHFINLGLTNTAERTGVLIFVSVAERYVEILADSGINDKVPPDTWQNAVDGFIGNVKSGHVAQGFVSTIEACGTVLIENFPAEGRNPNELPDHLVEFEP